LAPRANWKGFLKIGELSCPVALYTAASEAERIQFHTVNRKTGNRVRRQFVDGETGKPVEPDDQVKGYEIDDGRYAAFEPEEIAAVVPAGDKTLSVAEFVACDDIDDLYFDRPYYLAPGDPVAMQSFVLIRDGMRKRKVAALARAVLFRRVRTLLVRPQGDGLVATTLNFDSEVRSSRDAFEAIGRFDPARVDDRYESAVAELVKAKLDGRKLPKPARRAPAKIVDLMQALRESAAPAKTPPARRRRTGRAA
jgi:DNA end-binding protein Ku